MALSRLPLPDGQWADLLLVPRHAEYITIIEAAEDASRGRETEAHAMLVVGQQYTKAWSVRDPETGAALSLSDWGPADPDITDAICTEAFARWKEWDTSRTPLVTPWWQRVLSKLTPESSSPDTPRDSPSSSPTASSPTPSSSRRTRPGRNAT
jgi:hypothetical protein